MRQRTPEICVLLGVYNAERTLPRTLDSLQAQSYKNFEVLVINDASTDNSLSVLKEYQERWGPEKIRILTNKTNLGLTRSLNYGLKNTTAKYTARIDADDWWQPNKLTLQAKYLEKNPTIGVLGCWYCNIGQDGRSHELRPPTDDVAIRRAIVRRNPFAHSCIIFKTGLIISIGGYDPTVRYGQDYDLWFRCLPLTKLANLPEVLCYRQTGRGISVDKQRQQMLQSLRTQLKYIRRYHLSWLSYLGMIEPLIVILTPNWLKKIKRVIWP